MPGKLLDPVVSKYQEVANSVQGVVDKTVKDLSSANSPQGTYGAKALKEVYQFGARNKGKIAGAAALSFFGTMTVNGVFGTSCSVNDVQESPGHDSARESCAWLLTDMITNTAKALAGSVTSLAYYDFVGATFGNVASQVGKFAQQNGLVSVADAPKGPAKVAGVNEQPEASDDAQEPKKTI